MTAVRRKLTNDRITVEALRYYIPFFHEGHAANERILNDETLTPEERNALETKSRLKKLSTDKIAALSGPLITREINKLIKNSHLNGREDLFDILYYAGIGGLMKGLRHFDVDKINKSSTNYIFQWIVTYAKKELSVIEAPFGIAPSRFQKYKKISAVRKKMTDNLGRYAENDEVLAFFHSGQADIKNMSGRLDKPDKLYASNQNMTLELVEEQEHFEQNLNYVSLLDPLDAHSFETKTSVEDHAPFDESLFGVFLATYNFTDSAKAVFMSDLGTSQISDKLEKTVESISSSDYKRTSNLLKELMKDESGPFYEFLSDSLGRFDDFDIKGTMKQIERYTKKVNSERYLVLFIGKKVEKI